ncbi:MAG: squalene/phytoene synthase family protein [Paracoccaceae bacterium]
MNDACAEIVQRDDPHLYATALFAPEPARSGLMVLYAFDCELSRAAVSSKESLIPRMRLQWWRDAIQEAQDGKPPKAHDVAAPLAAMIADETVDPIDLGAIIQAREAELARPLGADAYRQWHEARFNSLVASAAGVLARPGPDRTYTSPPQCSYVHSAAYVVRNSPAMAAAGEAPLMAEMVGEDWAALARGHITESLGTRFHTLAEEGLDELTQARSQAHLHDPRIRPALLPLRRAERVLRLVLRTDFALGDLDRINRPFDGFKLAFAALRGRW